MPDANTTYVFLWQGGTAAPSEYVRAFVRDAQQRQAKVRLEALLLEALDSCDPIVMSRVGMDSTDVAAARHR